jgi:hypothetical protein
MESSLAAPELPAESQPGCPLQLAEPIAGMLSDCVHPESRPSDQFGRQLMGRISDRANRFDRLNHQLSLGRTLRLDLGGYEVESQTPGTSDHVHRAERLLPEPVTADD